MSTKPHGRHGITVVRIASIFIQLSSVIAGIVICLANNTKLDFMPDTCLHESGAINGEVVRSHRPFLFLQILCPRVNEKFAKNIR